ncbi:MAG: hypothetical protein BIFFINMI_01476 [Phycisphaerae bacterium]|nr:hypothetical protein [Phycisphaerae bacterium]
MCHARRRGAEVFAAVVVALCALTPPLSQPARAADPAAASPAGVALLTQESPWRWHIAMRKPLILTGKADAAPEYLPIVKLHGGRGTPDIQFLDTAPPDAAWSASDFDDTDWPRSRGSIDEPNLCVGLLCLRGRFQVADPAAVTSLKLEMKFRGGVIVYLNGKEIARSHLSAGAVKLTEPGEAYPDTAWVDAAGKALPIPRFAKGDEVARIATRDRTLPPLDIPADRLRKGTNVLAVELHRSDYHPAGTGWWAAANMVQGITRQWTPVGLLELHLSAEGSGAAAAKEAFAKPAVWTADLNSRIEDVPMPDSDELLPMRIVGARNGVFSGMAVVSNAGPVKGVKAEAGELNGPAGKIPASAVAARYMLFARCPSDSTGGGRGAYYFNPLTEQPPGEVEPLTRVKSPFAAVPIVLTVRVPRDAVPGDYAGELRVSAEGLPPTAVPVRLHVADWTLPDPLELRARVGLFQSPTSVAMHYGVKEWSEEHWKLLEKSFAMLGQVGADIVNIPIVERTQFGNNEGMITWIRKPDGSYDHDFTVFEQYLKLVKKHLGSPRVVALHVWHPGTWKVRDPDEENTVTLLDAATGKREHLQVPVFGTEASKAFFKPVLEGCRQRLAKEGMDKSMALGILCDATAPPEVFKEFEEIAPGAGWTRGCHSVTFSPEPYPLKGGGVCVYHEFCYGLSLADPAKGLPRIWEANGPGVAWFRGEYDYRLCPYIYRTMIERGLDCRTSGAGRMGLDFWGVPANEDARRKGRLDCIFNRWPNSSVAGHGDPTITCLAHPGPDGAQATVRFELFREGLQESEAMIRIAEAQDKHADRLGKELTDRCRRIFVDRMNMYRLSQAVSEEFYGGWQSRSADLYATAAEVAGKLKSDGQ